MKISIREFDNSAELQSGIDRLRKLVYPHLPESSDVVSVYMTGRRLDRLPVRSGQFVLARFLDGPGSSRGNPFSLSAAPDGRSLRISAKALGAGSARLAHLRPQLHRQARRNRLA